MCFAIKANKAVRRIGRKVIWAERYAVRIGIKGGEGRGPSI